jgi:hypothetical protein
VIIYASAYGRQPELSTDALRRQVSPSSIIALAYSPRMACSVFILSGPVIFDSLDEVAKFYTEQDAKRDGSVPRKSVSVRLRNIQVTCVLGGSVTKNEMYDHS